MTIWTSLPHETYFSLIARGFGIDVGAGISLVLGVVSTQSYAQAIMAGKSFQCAKRGTMIAAFLAPPIGICGILVGMYMKLHFPNINPAQALPIFVIEHLPSLFSGIVLATLLITIVGTGAGLTLGITSVINNDIIKKVTNKGGRAKGDVAVSRLLILFILGFGLILTVTGVGDQILLFSYMSMGFRASVMFVPLCAALFLKGKVDSAFINLSIVLSPLSVFIGNFMNLNFDPLFLGMAVSVLLTATGVAYKKPDRRALN